MEEPFAIYVRVSEVGGRGGPGFASPEEQEAAARAWADRNGVELYFEESECVDLDVSGGLAAEDRKLGGLIERCESGELGGIIVRYETRFARDVIAGAATLKRLEDCGARLVATASGFDSANLTPESRMVFNMMMSVGQAERERARGNYMSGKLRAARRGEWCGIAPFGYDRDENRRLVPNKDADTVREAFRLRVAETGYSEMARLLPGTTRSGLRKIVSNRAYVGEQRVPNPEKKGELVVLENDHPPLVTEEEWEAANAVRRPAPAHNGIGRETILKGVCRCGRCSSTMHVLAYGNDRSRRTYACTGCGATSMAVLKVDPAVTRMLGEAIGRGEPGLTSILREDDRHRRALEAVERAKADLVDYRDSIEIQRELGASAFAEGLRVRRQAIETARRALRETPRPPARPLKRPSSREEMDLEYMQELCRRTIAEVRIHPRSAPERMTVRWADSDEHLPVPPAPEADAVMRKRRRKAA
jgi:DNA invertase Pin-like site-specific DNA recombinase